MSEKRVRVTIYANTIGLLSHFCLFVFLYSSSFFFTDGLSPFEFSNM